MQAALDCFVAALLAMTSGVIIAPLFTGRDERTTPPQLAAMAARRYAAAAGWGKKAGEF
jgi:hypothetical protein